MIQREFEPFCTNRLANLKKHKRKFKKEPAKLDFKPKISKKSRKLAKRHKKKLLSQIDFGVSNISSDLAGRC